MLCLWFNAYLLLLCYLTMVVGDNESTATKNAGDRWQFRLPGQWSGTTRGASPDGAHPGRHWMPPSVECLCRITPAAAMVKEFESNTHKTNKTQLLPSNYGTFWSLVVCENFNPKTDPILSSSMQWVSCKCETPRFEPSSAGTTI